MIRYTEKRIDQRLFANALNTWKNKGWLHDGQIDGSRLGTEEPYRQYAFLKRAGMYFITLVATAGAMMLFLQIALVPFSLGYGSLSALYLLMGIALYVAADKFSRRMYRHGPDDAVLHTGFFMVCGSLIAMIMDTGIDPGIARLLAGILICGVAWITVRLYADSLIAVCGLAAGNAVPLLALSLIDTRLLFFSALVLIPLNLLILAAINRLDRLKNHYWQNCFAAMRFTCCLLMYAGVNLFVVQSLAFELMGKETIPLRPFFVALTTLFPFVLLAAGLKKKARYLVHAGLLMLLLSVATIRHYYQVMPAELALVLGGAALTLVSYFSIRYLRNHETPYTFEPAAEDQELKDAELLMIVQQFGQKPGTVTGTGDKSSASFNGGQFGGAGSGGDY